MHSVDVYTRQLLYRQLVQVHQNTKKTILFGTHNINEEVALGDRVILMSSKLANTKKEFRVDLPHSLQINDPVRDAITKEIMEESRELYFYHDGEIGDKEIASMVLH